MRPNERARMPSITGLVMLNSESRLVRMTSDQLPGHATPVDGRRTGGEGTFAEDSQKIVLIIKALNYVPSPASPAQPSKCPAHFLVIFLSNVSSKMIGEREMTLFQNRKNKIVFGPKIHGERIESARFVALFFSNKFHAFLQSHMVIQISKARFPLWISEP